MKTSKMEMGRWCASFAAAVGALLSHGVPASATDLHALQATPEHTMPGVALVTPRPYTSGGWSGQIAGPNLYNTNVVYQTADIKAPAGVPAGGKITTIYFSYAFHSSVKGLYVEICDNVRCVVVESNVNGSGGSGSTTAFAGDQANTDFAFAFDVAGNGSAINPPVYGGNDTISVNYTY